MSNKEKAIHLLEQLPESKMYYIISFLENTLSEESEDIPNEDTIEAMKECEEMIKNGTGQRFEGSTADFLQLLLEDETC